MYDQELRSLSQASRRQIIEHFWGIQSNEGIANVFQDDSYFEFFESQCHNLQDRLCTRRNIFDIVHQIKAGADRSTIKASLLSQAGGTPENRETSVNYTIDLVVKLWLMVHTRNVKRGVTGQTALLWQEGCLKDCVAAYFQHQRILTDSVKFERIFNARNIEHIAGVTICWTPNLIDHLKFIEDGKKPVLHIFHHAAFLNYHRDVDFFPSGFVEETIRTLALLLPAHDQASRKWFRKRQAKLSLDPSAMKCGQLKLEERQIDHFNFWHDRLVILKQFFDDSSPRTIKQWWFDDRKRVQWFWVAILLVVCTSVFGLIQCIEGGWQIWKAYHP